MKYEVKFTTQVKKDLKLAKKQGKDIEKLLAVVENWQVVSLWRRNIAIMRW